MGEEGPESWEYSYGELAVSRERYEEASETEMLGREGELGRVGDSGRGVVARVRVEEVAAGESATRVAECSSLVSGGEERSTFEEKVEDDKETCCVTWIMN